MIYLIVSGAVVIYTLGMLVAGGIWVWTNPGGWDHDWVVLLPMLLWPLTAPIALMVSIGWCFWKLFNLPWMRWVRHLSPKTLLDRYFLWVEHVKQHRY